MVVVAMTAVCPDSDGTRGSGVVAGGEPMMSEVSTINTHLDVIQYLAENCQLFYILQNSLELLDTLVNTLKTTTNQPSPGLSHRVKVSAAMKTLLCYSINSSVNGLINRHSKDIQYSEIIDDIIGQYKLES
ncbi:hypothetical protein Pcinc_044378 [Petrolisthes cinctipes]|uniref:Uncharacterized protein n=1 Tax=Petrolisthes cinctipes TaxID=88211 RepID=A0AAE1EEE3_PETCI|nr:hypothetical protein Pcinc_044378 [Petrolisthes cinctipes]